MVLKTDQMEEDNTDPLEFQRFHLLLTKNRPGYVPIYIKLKKNTKDPIDGVVWGRDGDPGVLSFMAALRAMREGYNIGVVGRKGDSQVTIDIDDMDVTPDATMKRTLSMASRSRIGRHYMYTSTDPEAKKNVSPSGHVGEVRVDNQYVVCPGSYVPCDQKEFAAVPADQKEFAGRYTIENDLGPVDITFAEFPQIFHDAIEKKKRDETIRRQIDAAQAAKRKERGDRGTVQWEFLNLSVSTVIGGIPSGERFPSPFHKSRTKKDTSYDSGRGLLTCWKHHVTHTASSALAVVAGVADCQSAGKGTSMGSAGPSVIDYADPETILTMWIYAKHKGMLPADDRIPQAVVLYVALDKQLCTDSELENGWKMPDEAYNKALELIQAEAQVSLGRNPIGRTGKTMTKFRVINVDGFNAGKDSIEGLHVETVQQGGEQMYQCNDRARVEMWAEHRIIEIVENGSNQIIEDIAEIIPLIERVDYYGGGDGEVYFVYISGWKNEFNGQSIMEMRKWKEVLYHCGGRVLMCTVRSTNNKRLFAELLRHIYNIKVVKWQDHLTERDVQAESVMNAVFNLIDAESMDMFIDNPRTRFLTERNGEKVIYVKSDTMGDILYQVLHDRVTLQQLSPIIGDYLARSSVTIKPGKREIRVWVFKPGR